ncbi:hypothetical protein [Posidoniimonas corsicana]|uniref:hypothetical protein n=1 Tax=Posidoniimonas corsicana TaxID=1938618 RepID=UPI0011B5493E|nr:hypothetical protein [Posidoniimonas corsicana]
MSVAGDAIAPLYTWAKGDGVPYFRPAAYQLRKRWRTPGEQLLLYPTDKACRLHGGDCTRPRSQGETDHDLWVASVFLHYRQRDHGGAEGAWVSGDTLRCRGEVGVFDGLVPDACLTRADGSIKRVVEIGGKGYGATKLARLHDCYSQQAAYELW